MPNFLTSVGQRLGLGSVVSNAPMNWAFADQVLNSAQNFAVGLAIARLGGIDAFGAFTLVFVISMLAAVIQDEFLAAPMMTYAGGTKRRTRHYFSGIVTASVAMAIAGGAITGLIVCAIVGLRDGQVPLWLALTGAAATAANSHFVIVKRLSFARDKPKDAFLLSLGRALVLLAAVPLLLLASVDLTAEIWLALLAISAAVASIVSTMTALGGKRLRPWLLRALLDKHWKYARWLLLMVAVSMGQEQFVWLWVGAIEGDKALGGLRAGQYLLGLTHVIMIGMHNFVALQAARAFASGGHGELTDYLIRQTLVLGAMLGSVIVCLALFSETWMRLVFGEAYVAYASTLRWFCLIYSVVFVREVWVIYLRTLETTRAIFSAFAYSSLFALVCTYPAIELAGLHGALAVVLIAHTISLVLIAHAIKCLRKA